MRWWLLLIGIAATVRAAEPVAVWQLKFSGNRMFSDAELRSFLNVRRGTPLTSEWLAEATERLVDSLIARDLLFARVDSVVESRERLGARLVWFVSEGKLAAVNEVRWAGDSLQVAAAADAVGLQPRSEFRWSTLRQDLNLLLDRFTANGYPYARVELERVDTDSSRGTADLYLKLTSGPYTRIEFVDFAGLRGTNEAMLRRYLRFKTPVPYNEAAVTRAQRRLARLEFLRRVEDARLVVHDDGRTGLQFQIEEARATRLDAVAGFLPGKDGKRGSVSGLINLDFINLLGSGRKGHVYWSRPDERTQAVEVAYREPWLLNSPLSLSGEFAQRVDDTLYVTRKFGFAADVELGLNFSVTGGVRLDAVFADSVAAAALGIANSSTIVFETGMVYDTRDYPANPRHGVRFATAVGSGRKHRERLRDSLAAGDFSVQRVSVDAEAAEEVLPYWVVSLAMHARGSESDEPEIPITDLYRSGGARTVRGYREEQFQGSRIGWAAAEIRYLLGEASRVYVFADAASIYREVMTATGPRATSLFRPATGIGLRLESALGVWGFDYGIGRDDRVLNGKVHFSLYTSF